MRRWFVAVVTVAVMSLPAGATEVQGRTDLFSGHGVVLAWALARGPDAARTDLVIRVVTKPPIRSMVVRARDPATQAEQFLVPETPTGGRQLVRIPRAAFAQFPRIEWEFYDSERSPRLVVFYLGIPATVREFADEARLEAYLGQRAGTAR